MIKRIAFLATVLYLLTAALAQAQGLPPARPEQVGLSSERLHKIVATLKTDSEKLVIPGAVVVVARQGKIALFEAVGVRDPDTKAPMAKDAIFRIYSMSKPITSVAAMTLVEDGKLALADPIAKYLPQLGDVKVGVEKPDANGGQPMLERVPARRPITVQDLMRHTSGFTYGVFGVSRVKATYREAKLLDGNPSNADFVDRLALLPLAHQPGSTWEYSHSTDVLGRVVEVVSGKSLYEFDKERILEPLGMKDTSFYVTDAGKLERIAEPFPDDRTLASDTVMNDPRVVRRWESGGGGMVGTALDYARFAQMLLNGGTLDGKRILGPKTVAYMTSDHLDPSIAHGPAYLPGPGFGFGLGFAVRKDAGVAAVPGSVGEYNWGGAGGTYFWVDPKEEMVVVFMMQSPKQRTYYRALLKDMIYASLTRSLAK
jgi:CubicO group peptidase (beta-lactamase class C family)